MTTTRRPNPSAILLLVARLLALTVAGWGCVQPVEAQAPTPPAPASSPSETPAPPPPPPPPAPMDNLRWQAMAPLPLGVFDAASSLRGRSVVVTGGIDQAGVALAVVQTLHLDAGTWTHAPLMAEGRCMHAQVTMPDGRVAVFGGQTGHLPARLAPTDTAELLDLDTQTRLPLPPLPQKVKQPTAHVLPDGRVVVIAGAFASVLGGESLKWQQQIKLREPRDNHASAMLPDGRIVVAGGLGRMSIELITPGSSTLADGYSKMLGPRLPQATDDLRVIALDQHRVLIVGGQDSRTGQTTDRTWLLDLQGPKSTMTPGPALGVPAGVADACVGRIEHFVLVVGGESEQAGRDTELNLARLIDTRDLRVWSLPSLPWPHDDATAVAAPNALILVGGFRMQKGPISFPVAMTDTMRLELPMKPQTPSR